MREVTLVPFNGMYNKCVTFCIYGCYDSSLHYKHVTIVSYTACSVAFMIVKLCLKFKSTFDDSTIGNHASRGIIVQATGLCLKPNLL
jgi:hypothetical protein